MERTHLVALKGHDLVKGANSHASLKSRVDEKLVVAVRDLRLLQVVEGIDAPNSVVRNGQGEEVLGIVVEQRAVLTGRCTVPVRARVIS